MSLCLQATCPLIAPTARRSTPYFQVQLKSFYSLVSLLRFSLKLFNKFCWQCRLPSVLKCCISQHGEDIVSVCESVCVCVCGVCVRVCVCVGGHCNTFCRNLSSKSEYIMCVCSLIQDSDPVCHFAQLLTSWKYLLGCDQISKLSYESNQSLFHPGHKCAHTHNSQSSAGVSLVKVY